MKSCLIVDDSVVIRKIVRQVIENVGFSCSEAENGAVAYDHCVKEMPTLVMLDWNMPVMNGLEFLKKLRAHEKGGQPVVIFCTTESDMSFIQAALEAGANDYIMKPFNDDILRDKLLQNNLIEA